MRHPCTSKPLFLFDRATGYPIEVKVQSDSECNKHCVLGWWWCCCCCRTLFFFSNCRLLSVIAIWNTLKRGDVRSLGGRDTRKRARLNVLRLYPLTFFFRLGCSPCILAASTASSSAPHHRLSSLLLVVAFTAPLTSPGRVLGVLP